MGLGVQATEAFSGLSWKKKKKAVMFLYSIYNVSSIMISAFYILFYLTIEETLRALRYTVLLITEEEK